MSVTWFECKVKYRKTHETGEQKVTSETYLLDAVSYTEAEARMNEEMTALTSEEFQIMNIKVANFSEIHPFENTDRWFKSKVSLVALDEESGKERKTNIYLLVQANDIKEAFDNTTTAMKDTMGDYTIPMISESPIIDVFPYFSGEEGEEIPERLLPKPEDHAIEVVDAVEVNTTEADLEEEVTEEAEV